MTGWERWYNEVFKPKVQHAPETDVPLFAEELVDSMLAASRSGDKGARLAVRQFLRTEAEARIKSWSRGTQQVRAKVRGRATRQATRYTFSELDRETGNLTARVHRSMWDVPRIDFQNKMSQIDRAATAASDAHLKFHAIWNIWNDNPRAATARIAWEGAGRSTEEIDLDDLAG